MIDLLNSKVLPKKLPKNDVVHLHMMSTSKSSWTEQWDKDQQRFWDTEPQDHFASTHQVTGVSNWTFTDNLKLTKNLLMIWTLWSNQTIWQDSSTIAKSIRACWITQTWSRAPQRSSLQSKKFKQLLKMTHQLRCLVTNNSQMTTPSNFRIPMLCSKSSTRVLLRPCRHLKMHWQTTSSGADMFDLDLSQTPNFIDIRDTMLDIK